MDDSGGGPVVGSLWGLRASVENSWTCFLKASSYLANAVDMRTMECLWRASNSSIVVCSLHFSRRRDVMMELISVLTEGRYSSETVAFMVVISAVMAVTLADIAEIVASLIAMVSLS